MTDAREIVRKHLARYRATEPNAHDPMSVTMGFLQADITAAIHEAVAGKDTEIRHAQNNSDNERARAEAREAVLREALEGIKWKSADMDNMEFTARITYTQMDAIRTALASTQEGKERT